MSLIALSSILYLSVPAAPAPQESYGDIRLSRNQARTAGEVREPAFVPGAPELVFRADRASKSNFQLYRAPADGSAAPAELHPSWVNAFEVSPDGAWVVFFASDGFNVRSLGGGGTSLRLTNVRSYRLTPDSTRVVYLTHDDDLFVAALDGSTAPELLADLSALGSLGSLIVTPDATRVLVAEIDPGHLETVALHSVELSGGAPVLLTPPLPVDRHHMGSLRIDPSSTRAVYTLDELIPPPPPFGPPTVILRELFSVPLDGSAAPVRLNDHGASDARLQSVVGVDASGNVVFQGNSSASAPSEVYHVPLDGSAPPQRLHAPLPPGAACQSANLAADGSRVAFVLYFGPSSSGLYSAPPDGSAPAVLLSGSDVLPGFQPVLSPDGARAVYESQNPPAALRSVRLDGSAAPVTLVASLPAGAALSFGTVAVSADSSQVLFLGDLDTPDVQELYSVPITGGIRSRRSDPLASGGSVSSFLLPPSGDEVAYLVQASSTSSLELRTNTIAGGTSSADVSQMGEGPLAGFVRVHADAGGRVIYRADHLVFRRDELFSVPVDGSAEPVRLHATPPVDGDVLDFRVSAAAGRVVFRGDVRVNNRNELFAAPLDGSAPAVLLHPALSASRNVSQFALSPDGALALYLADSGTDEVYRLFRVPTDASAAPVEVSGTLVTGGDVRDFAIDAAGTHVVYLADQATDEVVELWARPLDLSSAPVRISTTPVLGGDVDSFVLAPDGTRAVYLADQTTNEVLELFGAPTDGSAPAVRLSPSLVLGGRVARGFAIDPTSTRVVFRASALSADQDEIFSAPLDGSVPAVRLNPTLAAAGDITDFQLDPLGQRVVFRAYTVPQAGYTLYSAWLDGSAPATLVTQPLIQPGVLPGFSIDPSAEYVCFLGRVPGEAALTLFQRRIDGTGTNVQLSPSGQAAGGPSAFFQGAVIHTLGSSLVRVALEGGPGLALTRSYGGSLGAASLQEGRLVFHAAPLGGSSELYSTRLAPKTRRR